MKQLYGSIILALLQVRPILKSKLLETVVAVLLQVTCPFCYLSPAPSCCQFGNSKKHVLKVLLQQFAKVRF